MVAAPLNFGPGPAMLPRPVLQRIAEELRAPEGLPVLELHHRDPAFAALAERLESRLRELLALPAACRVLFLQGGASAHFALAPLNFLRGGASADYLHTGYWSGRAFAEAQRLRRARLAASGRGQGFCAIPPREEWRLDPEAAYVFCTANETVEGIEFPSLPEVGAVPLVADMSSNFLSRPVALRGGLVFAAAQKNLGIPGLSVAIIGEGMLDGSAPPELPSLCDYRLLAEHRSLYNTPATFSWYVAVLMLDWLREQGGLAVIAEKNRRNAELLYATIDASGLYSNEVAADCRSRMNVVFRLVVPELTESFLERAGREGLLGLAGHRSRGGLRASLYNAMPEQGVRALCGFMEEFERRHG